MKVTAELLDMSDDVYHSHSFSNVPHYSNSIGKILLTKSPQHAWLEHPILNIAHKHENDLKFSVGTAAHAMLLQGLDVCEVIDHNDYRTTAAKEARDAAYAAGKTPLLKKQYAQVCDMVIAATNQLGENTEMDYLFSDGKAEQTIIMTKGDTKIKTRLDWLSNDGKLILDYKTTDVANPDKWMRQMSDMGADMQSALYVAAAEALTGVKPRFVFAVQEVKPPYPMYFVECFGPYEEYGQSRTNRAIATWEQCIASNTWPMYDKRIQAPDLPPYIEAQWLEREMEHDATLKEDGPGVGHVSKEQFLFGRVKG